MKIKVANPAIYRLWVLARKRLYFSKDGKYMPEKQVLNYNLYRVGNKSNNKESKLILKDYPDYIWSGCDDISCLYIDVPGEYILELEARESNWGMALDKIVLSAKKSFKPFGKGPDETDNIGLFLIKKVLMRTLSFLLIGLSESCMVDIPTKKVR